MDYQVISRRWRPKKFEELVGQPHIVKTLINSIKQNRIPHAFLFTGPRGTGKTSMARLLAQALNCENGPSVDGISDSIICDTINKGSCLDVIEIDGASYNSVEHIRNLCEECKYTPIKCRFKIYIIDEIHMLSNAAFNALLKTLEEPPKHIKFIFATTQFDKVIPTISSRCQKFDFKLIDKTIIYQKLKEITKLENITIQESELLSIARMANGGMRDAQSILDQLISFCGNQIEEKDIIEIYGFASKIELKNLLKFISYSDYNNLIKSIDFLTNSNRNLLQILIDLQEIVFTAIQSCCTNNIGYSNLLGKELCQSKLIRILEILQKGELTIQSGISQKVNFGITLLKAAEESESTSIKTIINKFVEVSNNFVDFKKEKKKLV